MNTGPLTGLEVNMHDPICIALVAGAVITLLIALVFAPRKNIVLITMLGVVGFALAAAAAFYIGAPQLGIPYASLGLLFALIAFWNRAGLARPHT